MKSLFNKYVWLQLILSILLLFGGVLIIVFAINGKEEILADALNITTAVILFLFGAFAIIASFVFETNKVVTNGLLYGSACIALGVFLCMKKLVLLEYLVYLLGIFFIVIGTVELIKAIIVTVKLKDRIAVYVVAYIVAALFIAGGILALIFHDNVKTAFCIIGGILLVAAGVYELFMGIRAMVAVSKGKGGNAKHTNKKAPKKEEPKQEEIKEIDYTKKSEQIEQKKSGN